MRVVVELSGNEPSGALDGRSSGCGAKPGLDLESTASPQKQDCTHTHSVIWTRRGKSAATIPVPLTPTSDILLDISKRGSG